MIDAPAFAAHQDMQASIAETAPLAGQFDQAAFRQLVQRLRRTLVVQHRA